jgi:hypothetical protein
MMTTLGPWRRHWLSNEVVPVLDWAGIFTISPERGLPGRSQATKDSAAAGRLGHPRRLVRGPSSSVRQPPKRPNRRLPEMVVMASTIVAVRGLTETTSRARLNRWYAWSGNACIAAC